MIAPVRRSRAARRVRRSAAPGAPGPPRGPPDVRLLGDGDALGVPLGVTDDASAAAAADAGPGSRAAK